MTQELSPIQREVLILIAVECGGSMKLRDLRAAYRKIGTPALLEAVATLRGAGFIDCRLGGTASIATWFLTDQGIAAADKLIRLRAARELLPLNEHCVRLLKWLLSTHMDTFCPVISLDKAPDLSPPDLGAGVPLVHCGLLQFDNATNGVRVTRLGRSALEVTETILGPAILYDPPNLRLVSSFKEMVALHAR